jgi:hypothetical protein
MFLVVIDAHSKWIDAYPMNSSTSMATIEKLRQSFAIHGLPETLVSDNGTCFTSQEFQIFTRKNGIKHIKSAPFRPATNGLAERAVQTLKQGLKKMSTGSVETKVSRVLSMYRVTPQATTGLSPAELLFNRKVRTRLDLVMPCVEGRVEQRQMQQKLHHDRLAVRTFTVGQTVNVKNFARGSKWLPGVVVQVTGPLSYMVKLQDGRVIKRHVDHILSGIPGAERFPQHEGDLGELIKPAPAVVPSASAALSPPVVTNGEETSQEGLNSPASAPRAPDTDQHPAEPCRTPVSEDRPRRQSRMPERFKDYVMP